MLLENESFTHSYPIDYQLFAKLVSSRAGIVLFFRKSGASRKPF